MNILSIAFPTHVLLTRATGSQAREALHTNFIRPSRSRLEALSFMFILFCQRSAWGFLRKPAKE
jgi:hypothetical protein